MRARLSCISSTTIARCTRDTSPSTAIAQVTVGRPISTESAPATRCQCSRHMLATRPVTLTPPGRLPSETVAVTLLVAALMTDTLLLAVFVTHTRGA